MLIYVTGLHNRDRLHFCGVGTEAKEVVDIKRTTETDQVGIEK
jgi:hypothetical protein